MNTIATLHWLDAAIVLALVLGAALGARRGVLRQTFQLALYVVSFYAAAYLHGPVDSFVRTHLKEVADAVPRLQSFLAAFVVSYLTLFVITRLARRAVKAVVLKPSDPQNTSAIEAVGLKPIDRLLGAGLGTLVASLIVGAVLMGLTSWARS
jgi:uncharacterized membrane protein required for colicin V production